MTSGVHPARRVFRQRLPDGLDDPVLSLD